MQNKDISLILNVIVKPDVAAGLVRVGKITILFGFPGDEKGCVGWWGDRD
jgi:hypothetical protein